MIYLFIRCYLFIQTHFVQSQIFQQDRAVSVTQPTPAPLTVALSASRHSATDFVCDTPDGGDLMSFLASAPLYPSPPYDHWFDGPFGRLGSLIEMMTSGNVLFPYLRRSIEGRALRGVGPPTEVVPMEDGGSLVVATVSGIVALATVSFPREVYWACLSRSKMHT
jgi:hypothetical protein